MHDSKIVFLLCILHSYGVYVVAPCALCDLLMFFFCDTNGVSEIKQNFRIKCHQRLKKKSHPQSFREILLRDRFQTYRLCELSMYDILSDLIYPILILKYTPNTFETKGTQKRWYSLHVIDASASWHTAIKSLPNPKHQTKSELNEENERISIYNEMDISWHRLCNKLLQTIAGCVWPLLIGVVHSVHAATAAPSIHPSIKHVSSLHWNPHESVEVWWCHLVMNAEISIGLWSSMESIREFIHHFPDQAGTGGWLASAYSFFLAHFELSTVNSICVIESKCSSLSIIMYVCARVFPFVFRYTSVKISCTQFAPA